MSRRESSLSEALAKGAENIVDIYFRRAALNIQQQQLEFQRQQFSEEQQANAFQRVATLLPLMQPGQANPLIVDEMQAIFPDQDRGTIEALVTQPETLEQVVMPEVINRYRNLSPEARAAKQDLVMNRVLTGEATTEDQMALRDNLVGIQLQSLESVVRDPNLMEGIGRRVLGMEVPIRLTIPDGKGGLREVTFDTADSARLSVSIWQHQDTMDWYRTQATLSNQAKIDIAGEFMDILKEKGIALTRANAMRIIDAVHAENPSEAVNALRGGPGWTEQMEASLQLYLGGASLSEEVPAWIAESNPGLARFLELGSAIEGILGKEQAAEILPALTGILSRQGMPIAVPRRLRDIGPGGMPGRMPFTSPIGGMGFDQGKEMKFDAQEYAAGRMTLPQLTQKWGTEGAKAIIEEARQGGRQ